MTQPDPAGSIERMSVSALGQLRNCPQAWAYGHLRRLRRIEDTPAIPLEFGTWWHAIRGADAILRGFEANSMRKLPADIQVHDDLPRIPVGPKLKHDEARVLGEQVLEAAADWWKRLPSETRELWLDELRQPLPERLEHADRLWRRRWADDLLHEAPLAVEYRFNASIKGTRVPGVIDELLYDSRRGFAVLKDHKTGRDIQAMSASDDMMEPQLHIYAWAVHKTISEKWGHPLGAISYDRTRSVGPHQPKLTAMGNLAKTPSDYDLDTYRDWAAGPLGAGVEWGEPDSYYVSGAKKGQPKFGVYEPEEKIIEQLSTPAAVAKWNDRTLVPLNQNLIRTHLRSFVGSAKMAGEYAAEYERNGEVHRNLGRGCKWCDFKDLCRAEMIGGPGGDYPLDQFNLQEKR